MKIGDSLVLPRAVLDQQTIQTVIIQVNSVSNYSKREHKWTRMDPKSERPIQDAITLDSYEAMFEDGISYIQWFGFPPIDEHFNPSEQLERKILNKVAALHLVRQRAIIPEREVIAHQPAGRLSPRVRRHRHGQPTRRGRGQVLQRYLRDIADIHVQLSTGSFVFDAGEVVVGPGADSGLGPVASASGYFSVQAEAYEHLVRAAGEHDDDEEAEEGGAYDSDALKRRFVASLRRKVMMLLVDAQDGHGPFPMCHGDLHCDNILVDATGHISGVLDWDCAGTVPWVPS
ncbi:hypothetical protein D9619_008968 [Psilocybe cf. subviscida]|uniref:Aminoglycoside phosphotransferase domain-containing protein n=1 Tax=Psilocybe cf. subviscida TaxID=2480587 RepID=A0A8H5BUL2_9AGAR|nr:hypothetical protein D9619_008968 [Psilocybe cf. subviscida]